jgi:hypothetical protein
MSSREWKHIPKLFLNDHKRPTVVNARIKLITFDKLINGDVQGSTGQVVENYLFFVCYIKLYLIFVKDIRSDVRTDFLVYHILMEHVTKLMLPDVIVYDLYIDFQYPRLYKIEICEDQWKRHGRDSKGSCCRHSII